MDILFPLVVSRESSDLSNMIEPFFDTVNQRAEAKTLSNEVIKVVNQNRKSSMKKQKENTLEQVTVNSTRSFIDNKATGKLLNSLDDENKSLRRHNRPKWCRWCLKSIVQFITIKPIPSKCFGMHITNIGRGIYLTEIRILPNLNRQYHSQIFQRPVSEWLVNRCMVILKALHLSSMSIYFEYRFHHFHCG